MGVIPKAMTSRQSHSAEDRGDDLYETPPEATLALLRTERLPKVIWEPNAGRGAIVRVLRNCGHTVLSTDLVNYDSPNVDYTGVDFLRPLTNLPEVDAIVMNPPFRFAKECVDRAVSYAPQVYVLLRLAFLESEGRHRWFKEKGLCRIHLFSNRLPMMHRDGWDGPKSTSTTPFAWYYFERGFTGNPQLNWIMWQPQK